MRINAVSRGSVDQVPQVQVQVHVRAGAQVPMRTERKLAISHCCVSLEEKFEARVKCRVQRRMSMVLVELPNRVTELKSVDYGSHCSPGESVARARTKSRVQRRMNNRKWGS